MQERQYGLLVHKIEKQRWHSKAQNIPAQAVVKCAPHPELSAQEMSLRESPILTRSV